MKLEDLLKVIPAGQIIKITNKTKNREFFCEDRNYFYSMCEFANMLKEREVSYVCGSYDHETEEDIIIIRVKVKNEKI